MALRKTACISRRNAAQLGPMAVAGDFADLEPGEFARRRRAARQLGTPAWLWPEVSPGAWAEALADIGRAISEILGGHRARLSSSNPRACSVACYTAGVGPLLGWWLESGKLSAEADVAAVLAAHLDHARARERRVHQQATAIVSALAASRIPVIVLKGADTAYRYFPAPETRPASDIDLLVPFDSRHAAQAVLAGEGLKRIGRTARDTTWAAPRERREPKSRWLIHELDPWSVDLCNSLDFAASPGATVVTLDRADPFVAAEPWAIDPSAKVLSQPLLLLHLATHAGGGLHSLTLLRMIEIILVIRQDVANQRLSWDRFLATAAQTGGLGAAFPALAMCDLLVPGIVAEKVLACCRQAMPARARAVVDRLEPSTAHRVDRLSIGEHFMWVAGPNGWLRQLWSDLAPGAGSLRRIYEARIYRLLRGRITR